MQYKAKIPFVDYQNGIIAAAGQVFDTTEENGAILVCNGLCEKVQNDTAVKAEQPKRRKKAAKNADE